jgi:hypothetical protein
MEISHAVVSRAGLVTVLNYDRKVFIALATRIKAALINFDLEKNKITDSSSFRSLLRFNAKCS